MPKTTNVTMTQIISLPWDNTASIVGLGNDGIVYRYSVTHEGWIPYRTRVVLPPRKPRPIKAEEDKDLYYAEYEPEDDNY